MPRLLYIASTLDNAPRIRLLRDRLLEHNIKLSYDWTQHGRVDDESLKMDIAISELEGIKSARCVLLVQPAMRGSYFEFGAAYVLGRPIVVLDESGLGNVSFDHLPGLKRCSTEDSAVAAVLEILNGSDSG